MRRSLPLITLFLFALCGLPASARDIGRQPAPSPAGPWGYQGATGPEHWGRLSDDYDACRSGNQQSPVDISGMWSTHLPPLSFQYRSSYLSMVNTGQTIRVNYEPGSFLRISGQRYELQQLHFHTPSEHTIQGVPADMEIHLVHRDGYGNYAIVAIPVISGRRHNVVMARIGQNLPPHPGNEYVDYRTGIKPIFLLPTNRDYVSYQGSLTEPPCTEGVRWLVFLHPLEVPAEYVAKFRQIMGNNARPTQPLNGRRLAANK